MKKDSMSEKMSTATTTAGIDQKTFPKTPGTKNRGENAAIVVSTENVTGSGTGTLVISWEAADQSLAARPISLSFSPYRGGTWTPIASGLENTGRYDWAIGGRMPPNVFLRLEVRDEAGNVAMHETSEPVVLKRSQPAVSIHGVRPLGQGYRNAATPYSYR